MSRLSAQTNHGTAEKKSTILASNPVLRRLNKVNEQSESHACSYAGIAAKTVVFLLFSIAGIAAQRILESKLLTGSANSITIKGFETVVYTGELIALGVCVGAAIVFQLLAFFWKASTPVTGALYCVTQGYFISFLIFKVLEPYGYAYLGTLALALTMLIILIMAVLYATGVIRVTKKFKMVMLTLVITMVGISLLSFIGWLLPFSRSMVNSIYNNIGISIAMSVIFIIIAALFLICDFNTIDHVVNDKLPKKYEWQAAFGLSFTVLWLYLKVLDLVMTIAGNNRK